MRCTAIDQEELRVMALAKEYAVRHSVVTVSFKLGCGSYDFTTMDEYEKRKEGKAEVRYHLPA